MNKDEVKQALMEGKKVRPVTWDKCEYIYFCQDNMCIKDESGIIIYFKDLMFNQEFEIYEEPLQFTKRVWLRESVGRDCVNIHCSDWLQDYLFETSMSVPFTFKLNEEFKLYEITVKEIREEK